MKRYLFNKVVIVSLVICFCLMADSLLAAPPTIVVRSPSDNSTISYKTTIVFLADAKDQEDGILTDQSIIWMSDRDGFLGYGISFTKNTLSVGTHSITSTAKDSDGEESAASITVTVSNQSPEVLVTSPQDNIAKPQGTILTFLATAKDPEDGILTGQSVVWESDRDGFLGYGTSFTKNNLTVGTHVITITATDSFGKKGSDTITVIIGNTAPNILITSPANNSTHSKGTTVVFIANATDPEDGILTGQAVVWKSDRDGFLGYGTSVTTSKLSVGTHAITVTAKDSTGLESTDAINIIVGNASPEILIRLPANNSAFTYGESILFVASVKDAEDGALSGESVKWVSERDGFIGFGTSLSINTLSVGTHVINVTAKDSLGSEASSSLTITINEKEPAGIAGVKILKPQDGDTFLLNEYIEFQGEITADEEGNISDGTLVWRSSLEDAPLGTGKLFRINTLKAGKHLITLTATDSLSRSVSDFIVITVVNSLPVPSIISPADGSIFDDTDGISFRGGATDAEDGEVAGPSLSWTSDIDGYLGSGVQFSRPLSDGEHTITLTAKDNDGAIGRTTIKITINPTEQDQPITLESLSGSLPCESYSNCACCSLDDMYISIPLGQIGEFKVKGGHPPYRYYKEYPHIASMDIIGQTIRIVPAIIGETTFKLIDHYNNEKVVTLKVKDSIENVPRADAGGEQNVIEGTGVILDGTSSFNGNNGIISWNWSQIVDENSDNNKKIVLLDSTSPKTMFVAPDLSYFSSDSSNNESKLTFRLTVEDKDGNKSSDDVNINISDNGIYGYPQGVTTFYTIDRLNHLGMRVAGDGDIVYINPQYPEFIKDSLNRPENMIYGLIDFKIKVEEGADANLIIYFPQPLGQDFTAYKYSPSKGWYSYADHITVSSDRTKAYLILMDGSTGDDDGAADGMINDPIAFGTKPKTQQPVIPQPSDDGGGGGGGCFISTLL